MSRLIDADGDKLEELIYDNTYSPEYHIIMRGIQNLPTVDAVPVVRCGECAYSREPNRHDLAEKKACAGILVCCVGFDHVYPSSDDGLIFVDKDHFCADGERRES